MLFPFSLSPSLSHQTMQMQLAQAFPLSSYLIKPIQRITKYQLLIKVQLANTTVPLFLLSFSHLFTPSLVHSLPHTLTYSLSHSFFWPVYSLHLLSLPLSTPSPSPVGDA